VTTLVLPTYPPRPAPAPGVMARAIAAHVGCRIPVQVRPDPRPWVHVVRINLGNIPAHLVAEACELYADPVGAEWKVTA